MISDERLKVLAQRAEKQDALTVIAQAPEIIAELIESRTALAEAHEIFEKFNRLGLAFLCAGWLAKYSDLLKVAGQCEK